MKAITAMLDELGLPHSVRGTIDGVDAAGKTTLHNELASSLEQVGRQIISASVAARH